MFDLHWGWWVLWSILLLGFILTLTWNTLKPNEIVFIARWGKPRGGSSETAERGPGGIVLAIPLVDKLYRFLTSGYQAEWPAEPRLVDKEDTENPEPGKESPMRIAFVDYAQANWFLRGADIPSAPLTWEKYKHESGLSDEEIEAIESDPRHQSLNGELQIVTQWHNKKGFLWQFIKVMKGQTAEEMVAECNRRINDIVVKEVQAICGKMTFLHAVAHIDSISEILQKKVEKSVQEGVDANSEPKSDEGEPWGIEVDDVYIKALDPGKIVNIDLAKAASAKSRRAATIQDAEAEAEAIRLRGRGEADAIKTKAEAMSTPEGARAAELDAARHVAAETELIIATGDQSGGTNILPQVAGMKHIFENKGNKPPADERKKATEKPASIPEESSIEQVERDTGSSDESKEK